MPGRVLFEGAGVIGGRYRGGMTNPSNPFDFNSLGAMLQQLGAMMQSQGTSTGPVNWDLAISTARQAVAAVGDPGVDDTERQAIGAAVDLAETWLDEATDFPRPAATSRAWSRSAWLEGTLPTWQSIVEPIAEHVAAVTSGSMQAFTDPEQLTAMELPEPLRDAFPGGLPPEALSMLGPLMGMAQQMGASMFGMQVGQGLGALAGDVLSSSDIGIPLTEDHVPTLLPANIAAFTHDLSIEVDEVRLYLALREAAHQRLFAHVPWLRARLQGAIDAYARGIRLDTDRLQEAMGGLDPSALSDPSRLGELLGQDAFTPEDTPEQAAALARLETLLALVEGWVDDVVGVACGGRLPSADALAETMRRRRAAGGPAEKTFASLIGLELRPRSLREAATVWRLLRESAGTTGRDALWAHPDLLPTTEDLTDPQAFVERGSLDAALDAELDAFDDTDPDDPR